MTRRPKSVQPPAAPVVPHAASRPELMQLSPALLVPNPRNPRTHPPEQIERLSASLLRDGQTKPVLARRENHMLIAGHGVTAAALRLGLGEIAVLLWDVDQATADRVMLADNQFGDLSANDKEKVASLLGEIDQADYLATGFAPEEVAKLMASFDEAIEVVQIETTAVTDDFWVTCRGPLPQQAEVLARIKQLLAEYPQVSVELGVVTGT